MAVSWLGSGFDPLLVALVALLGLAALAAFLSRRGGPYLVLALGEAFAVGLGGVAPVLAVLAQPVIAALVVGTADRRAYLIGAGAATLGAAGMFLSPHALVPLLVLVVAGAAVVLALAGLEAWVRGRFTGASS